MCPISGVNSAACLGHLVREGVDDFEEFFAFVSDLRADEAATVERLGRELAAAEEVAG